MDYGLDIDPKLSLNPFQAKDKKRKFLRITFILIFKILTINYLNKHSFILTWFSCEDLTLENAIFGQFRRFQQIRALAGGTDMMYHTLSN